MRIIEELLVQKKLILPHVEVHSGGLGAINVSPSFGLKMNYQRDCPKDALDRLRRGELSGGRLVIRTVGENHGDRSVQ